MCVCAAFAPPQEYGSFLKDWFIYLKITVNRERKRGEELSEREILHLQVHSPNVLGSQVWAKPKPGASLRSLTLVAGAQELEPSSDH